MKLNHNEKISDEGRLRSSWAIQSLVLRFSEAELFWKSNQTIRILCIIVDLSYRFSSSNLCKQKQLLDHLTAAAEASALSYPGDFYRAITWKSNPSPFSPGLTASPLQFPLRLPSRTSPLSPLCRRKLDPGLLRLPTSLGQSFPPFPLSWSLCRPPEGLTRVHP